MVVSAFVIVVLITMIFELVRHIVNTFKRPPVILPGEPVNDGIRDCEPLDDELHMIDIQRNTLIDSISCLDRAAKSETDDIKLARILKQLVVAHEKLEKLNKREQKIRELRGDG